MPPFWALAAAGLVFTAGLRIMTAAGRRIAEELDDLEPARTAEVPRERPIGTLIKGADGVYRPSER